MTASETTIAGYFGDDPRRWNERIHSSLIVKFNFG